MLVFSVSVIPLIVIAIVNYFLSWIFYSPVVPWFKSWELAVGMVSKRKEIREEVRKSPIIVMGLAFIATFILSYGLQVIIHSMKVNDFLTGTLVGVIAWFTFALTISLNTLFEGRKPLFLVLNNVLYLITYALYGGILAIWK